MEESIPHSRIRVVDLPQGLSVAEAIQRYRAAPEVKYVEPNYRAAPSALPPTPNDPDFPKMYDLDNRGQYGGTFDADIDAPEAWADTTGSPSTVVAVIDTGRDISQRDLRDNIWTNPDEMPGNGIDDDNKYADDVHGWDFYHDDVSVFDNANQDAGRCPPWDLLSHTGSSIRSILRIVEHPRGRVRAASATEIFRRSTLRAQRASLFQVFCDPRPPASVV